MLIGTFFIFSGVELSEDHAAAMRSAGTYAAYLHSEIMRVVPTYVGLGVVVLLLALWIGLTRFPDFTSEHEQEDHGRFADLLRYPHLWLAVVAQFCYCGAQVSTWSAFIPYMKQYTGSTERTAAFFLTGNLVAMATGRFVSTGLMRWFAPAKMAGTYAIVNSALIAIVILHPAGWAYTPSSQAASSCRSCTRLSSRWA